MKTIGLIGGMSAQSSAEYYRIINERTAARLGGHHNARSLMLTVDFQEIEPLMSGGDWDRVAVLMQSAARRLEAGGADFILLCTNTVHRVAPEIEAAISIPFLHIADATAEAVKERGLRTVGLLGTRFTMEQTFYRGRLESRHGLSVLIPEEADRARIHAVIFDELCHGLVRAESRREFERVIDHLQERGAEGVILGCTEIMLLTPPRSLALPAFDTTTIHAERAVELALA